MKGHKTSRAHHALRIAFVAAMILLAPLFAKGQDTTAAPALTPPSLLPGVAPALRELPVGSEPTQVVLELTVDKDGSARDAVVIASGGSELDEAALEAVSQLRFQPATRDSVPIVARIPFRFTFQPKAAPPPPPPPSPPAQAPPEPAEAEGLTLDVQGDKPPREPTVYTIDIKEAQKLPGISLEGSLG